MEEDHQIVMCWIILIILMYTTCTNCKTNVNILVIEEEYDFLASLFVRTLNSVQESSVEKIVTISVKIITLHRYDEEHTVQIVCEEFSRSISLMLDFTWTGWKLGRNLANHSGIPYLKAGVTIHPFLKVAYDTLTTLRNATNAVFIFQNEKQLKQSLFYLLEYSALRVLVLNGLEKSTLKTIASMLPRPSFVVLIANTLESNDIFAQAMELNLIKMDNRWNLVFTDFNYEAFHKGFLSVSVTKYTLKKKVCCPLAQLQENCVCPKYLKITPAFLQLLSKKMIQVFENLIKNNDYFEPPKSVCLGNNSHNWEKTFFNYVSEVNKEPGLRFSQSVLEIYPQLEFQVTMTPSTITSLEDVTASGMKIADWNTEDGLHRPPGLVVSSIKRFFRIGMGYGPPFAFPIEDPITGNKILDNQGNAIWDGYCFDFLKRLAKEMNFDYEIVYSESYGVKFPNGSWDGLVADLNLGKTDMIIAPLTMTSEREQVVDFVLPYFYHSGISIVIRKPVRKVSLFKFMTVLRLEVWLTILFYIVITSFSIWLTEISSPYSAYNNLQVKPSSTRWTVLSESFWFVLTSFTPQVFREIPESISGRILVVSFWLIVVVMNSTFTASLAAFLTVERMQVPIDSLEELVKQSIINYTVVYKEDAFTYFQYMKLAEETLYRMWTDISLNISSIQSEFYVWDYPIRERYTYIWQQLQKNEMIPNASYGFQKVLESEEGEVALIHDHSEIQYRMSQNCNLTQIGEMFALQPLAIAVQIESDIKKEISRKILELQYEGFFDDLSKKYWNFSNTGICPNMYEIEGVTLLSLGGVFISTFCGLVLALVILCGEIVNQNCKKISNISSKQLQENVNYGILSRKEFGTVSTTHETNLIKPSLTYVSVLPTSQLI